MLLKLVTGDFNSILSADEVSNLGRMDKRRCLGFTYWIFTPGLINLGILGPQFVWTLGNSTSSFQGACLDKALCSLEWRVMFDNASVTHFPKHSFDHSSLLIKLQGSNNHPIQPHFQFQAAWLTHHDFRNVVQSHWNNGSSFK